MKSLIKGYERVKRLGSTGLDSRLADGGEDVGLTRRPRFTARKVPDSRFCWRMNHHQDHNVCLSISDICPICILNVQSVPEQELCMRVQKWNQKLFPFLRNRINFSRDTPVTVIPVARLLL
jgi:hypothetical protein